MARKRLRYAIFVQQGQETFRVRKFDANKNVYIIGSTPTQPTLRVINP